MLALVLGSGAVAVGWLEAAARAAHAAVRTEAALAAARDALIGYAASYPDQHAGRHGPGYLPCPDRNGNGSPNTPCPRKSLGRLPWRRLGLHDPRDGAGERLWYALADNFRANGHKYRPLNAGAPAELVVDGRSGIAAVLFAPGSPLSFQDRARDRFDPARYLEGGNETADDSIFASQGPLPTPSGALPDDRFNDRVVTISRDELMAAAGRRALATVRAVLREYRDAPWNPGVLPWLVPWSGAAEGAVPTPGTIAGRLPLAPRRQRPRHFLPGDRSARGRLRLRYRHGGCERRGAPGAAADRAGRAMHLDRRRADRLRRGGPARPRSRPGAGFRLDLHFTGDTTISPPAPADVRRRAVRAARWTADSHIEIFDSAGGAETGRGRIRFTPGPLQGALEVEGVAYPLAVGEEVPEWVLRNEWHRTLMVGSAPAFVPGGGAACSTPIDCLDVVRTTLDGRRDESPAIAVAVLAGTRLDHQSRSGSGLAMWFEGENANPANLRYETRHSNEFFNDRIAAVTPGPGGLAP